MGLAYLGAGTALLLEILKKKNKKIGETHEKTHLEK